MTDDQIREIWLAVTGVDEPAVAWDVIGFARAIEQASRRAALEECWEAVHGERLEDQTETHGDMAYERAIADCEHAILRLKKTTISP